MKKSARKSKRCARKFKIFSAEPQRKYMESKMEMIVRLCTFKLDALGSLRKRYSWEKKRWSCRAADRAGGTKEPRKEPALARAPRALPSSTCVSGTRSCERVRVGPLSQNADKAGRETMPNWVCPPRLSGMEGQTHRHRAGAVSVRATRKPENRPLFLKLHIVKYSK